MHTGVGESKPCEKERAMGGIFISYRREDSAGWTGRLAEYLKKQFGAESIFMDIDTIQPGIDFTEALQKAVSSCEVFACHDRARVGYGYRQIREAPH